MRDGLVTEALVCVAEQRSRDWRQCVDVPLQVKLEYGMLVRSGGSDPSPRSTGMPRVERRNR